MKKDLSHQAMLVVKHRARAAGLTQKQLAKNLGVSLPTIKRWYSGGTITLECLKSLCDEVGISLAEVFSSVEEAGSSQFQYTDEQERYLSAHPDCLAFFDNLLRGQTPKSIRKRFNLSDRKITQFLKALDKLELIQWLPGNKVRVLVSGEPAWRAGGPLALKLREEVFRSFLQKEERSKAHFLLHDYLPDDALAIETKISELLQFTARANRRAQFKPDSARPVALYLSLQDFRWSLDSYLN